MKAELDANGVIHLTAESPTEACALKQWARESLDDNIESLLIDASWPPRQQESEGAA